MRWCFLAQSRSPMGSREPHRALCWDVALGLALEPVLALEWVLVQIVAQVVVLAVVALALASVQALA